MKEMERNRRFFTWGFLAALAFLFSCGGGRERFVMPDGEAHQTLARIDSMMWRQPDSAFVRLLEFAESPVADSLDAFDQHYCQLLISELLYKNDYEQSNRSALLQAVDYLDSFYEKHGEDKRTESTDNLVFLDARSHYIKGVGYYERDSVVEACGAYLKALEIMEERFKEKDLVGKKAQFMALIYTKLCVVFSNQYLHEQAIHFGKCSLSYYEKKTTSPWHLPWILDEIGTQFHSMAQLDSAECYYRRAMEKLPDTNSLTYRDIAVAQVLLSYDKEGDFVSTLAQLHRLRSKVESLYENVARCEVIGEVYYREEAYDSAWVYLDFVFHETTSIASKKQAAEWLVQIGKEEGRYDAIQEMVDFLVPFATQDENLGGQKSQLTSFFSTYQENRLKLSHQKRLSMSHRWRWLFIGILLVSSFLLILLYKNKKRSIDNMQVKLTESEETLRMQREKASRLQKELAKYHAKTARDRRNDLLDEDICIEINDLLQGKNLKRDLKSDAYPELWLAESQLSKLENEVEKHFPDFVKKLSNKYPKIRCEEIHQCLLYLLNLDDTQIAALLHCDYSTVKKRSAKLKTRFGTLKELQVYLMEIM